MDDKLLDFEKNFSVLDRYGTDVTKDEYVTNPAIGRDKQIKELILILLTPEKSAILIGKPGIGKTAIVEGLAYRIQQNDVPDALKGYTIINIKTASLLGTMPSGESKVQKMIDELKTKEKVILFIDEIHMLIGATDSSSLDFANIFKEGLGRGSIKVIGATTTEEYERYILRDKAFTRRFQKVEVPEPSFDETVQIMMGTLPKFEKQTGRKMKYSPFIQKRIMSFLVDITSEYKRVYALGSRYPDVSLTLLKQAFSYTVYDGREYMDIFDVRKAIEDTKNIYPDVKKKELPRFEKEFEDIILEEKGEKEIEPWRLDKNQIKVDEPEEEVEEDPEKIVESYDQMMEEQKKQQEVIGVVQKKKQEEVLSRKKVNNDAKNLDSLLLGGDIGVLQDDKYGVRVPNIKVKINKELKKNQIDDVLLSGGIGSILDPEEKIEETQTYKTNTTVNDQLLSDKGKEIILNEKKKQVEKVDLYGEDDEPKKKEPTKPLNTMVINREAPPEKKKIEIDISKYMNMFGDNNKKKEEPKEEDTSEDDGGEPLEEEKKTELIDSKEIIENNNTEEEINKEEQVEEIVATPQEEIEEVETVSESTNDSEETTEEKEVVEEPQKITFKEYKRPSDSEVIKEISKYLNESIDKLTKVEKVEKKNEKGDESMYGQNFGGNIDFLMGNGNDGYQPNNGNNGYNPGMGMPNNQPPQNNMDFLMGGASNSMNTPPYEQGGFGMGPRDQGMGYNNNNNMGPANQFMAQTQQPVEEPKREALFGAPMYDETKEKEIEGSTFGQSGMNQQPGMNDPFNNSNESFFGAPMYSNDQPSGGGAFSKDNDIFGQLLLPDNNMRIQGGKITDDFSDLKMPPSAGKMIIGDVMDNVPPQNNFAPPMDQGYGQRPQQNGGYGMPGPGYNPGMDNGMMPQGYNQGMNQGYGMPGPGYNQGMDQGFMPQGYNQGMDQGFMPQGYNQGMDQGYGMNGQGYGMPNQMNNGYGQSQGLVPPPNNSGFNMDSGYGPQQNGLYPPQQGYNQGYGMNGQGYGMPNQMNNGVPYAPFALPRGPVFNELKVENNLLKKPSEIEKEKEEELEEEKKIEEEAKRIKKEEDEEFVKYSDLKSGKVDQSDIEKYVSQKEDEKEEKKEEEKPIPRVDLDLESGAKDEDDYLD